MVEQVTNPKMEACRLENWQTVDPDNLVKYYDAFLEDGDFEKYQPWCYINRDTVAHLRNSIEGLQKLLRGLWISNRNTGYGSVQWFTWTTELDILYYSMLRMVKALEAIDSRILDGENITENTYLIDIKGLDIPRVT